MKSKIFLLGAAALAMASCSNDEVINENVQGDVIAFTAQTGATSRSADSYCNNNLPADFKVWAKVSDNASGFKTYFENEKYVKGAGNVYTIEGNTRYWPDASIPVHFYAVKNAETEFKWSTTTPTIVDFVPALEASAQKDLLYAYTQQSRPAAEKVGQVPMNFRHALSQVVFYAKNTNKNLHVEISAIEVVNAKSKATFTYPTTVTDVNVESHDNSAATATDGIGTWAAAGDVATYKTSLSKNEDIAYNQTINLSDAVDATEGRDFTESLMLLPQTTTAWTPAGAAPSTGADAGTYFLLTCKIWNVANGTAVNKETDVLLWESTDTKKVAIPCAFNWELGKKYKYTFVFGDGNGGFSSEDGSDVLIPIKFEVSVDDFTPVNPSDVPMQK